MVGGEAQHGAGLGRRDSSNVLLGPHSVKPLSQERHAKQRVVRHTVLSVVRYTKMC